MPGHTVYKVGGVEICRPATRGPQKNIWDKVLNSSCAQRKKERLKKTCQLELQLHLLSYVRSCPFLSSFSCAI